MVMGKLTREGLAAGGTCVRVCVSPTCVWHARKMSVLGANVALSLLRRGTLNMRMTVLQTRHAATAKCARTLPSSVLATDAPLRY